ncbi:MAG TPA: N-methyl-L-tryptophan oxidase, partial [Gemmatimonadaceae bacterium]
MIERPHDVIVIGLGAMGSAAVYHLSRRGYRVLGLEAFGRGHERGSSHGRSRITREAYNEAREYVSLVRRANALWSALAEESGRSLFVETGGLNIGRPEATLVSGSLAAAKAENILHEYLTAAEVNARFPAYRLPDGFMAVYEPKAGLLYPEVCTAAHLDRAASLGADLHFDEPVRRWVADGSGVRVETGRATYWADRLVIAAGPWAGEVLSDLGLPLEVWRILHVHFEPDSEDRFSVGRCPWAMWDVSEGVYAAFTALPGDGVKFGRHDVGEVCTPDSARRGVEDAEVETLRQRLNAFMPGAGG